MGTHGDKFKIRIKKPVGFHLLTCTNIFNNHGGYLIEDEGYVRYYYTILGAEEASSLMADLKHYLPDEKFTCTQGNKMTGVTNDQNKRD